MVDISKLKGDERINFAVEHCYNLYKSESENNPTSLYCKFMKDGIMAIYKQAIPIQCGAIGLFLDENEINKTMSILIDKIAN